MFYLISKKPPKAETKKTTLLLVEDLDANYNDKIKSFVADEQIKKFIVSDKTKSFITDDKIKSFFEKKHDTDAICSNDLDNLDLMVNIRNLDYLIHRWMFTEVYKVVLPAHKRSYIIEKEDGGYLTLIDVQLGNEDLKRELLSIQEQLF